MPTNACRPFTTHKAAGFRSCHFQNAPTAQPHGRPSPGRVFAHRRRMRKPPSSPRASLGRRAQAGRLGFGAQRVHPYLPSRCANDVVSAQRAPIRVGKRDKNFTDCAARVLRAALPHHVQRPDVLQSVRCASAVHISENLRPVSVPLAGYH
jgi:hypothetical protein